MVKVSLPATLLVDPSAAKGAEKVEVEFKNGGDLLEGLLQHENVNKFLKDDEVLSGFCKHIGVDSLVKYFDRNEVCDTLTWDHIKAYYLDHMNIGEILEHIGFEKVRDHFADFFVTSDDNTSANAINNSDSPVESLLGQADE
jgi:hypothetical protein